MANFIALLLLTGNRYFVKPKEVEMPRIYAVELK